MLANEGDSQKVSRFPRAWALGITAACAVGAIMLTAVRKPDVPATAQNVPTVSVETQGADHATIAPATAKAGDNPVMAIVTTSEPAYARIAGAAGAPGSKKLASSR